MEHKAVRTTPKTVIGNRSSKKLARRSRLKGNKQLRIHRKNQRRDRRRKAAAVGKDLKAALRAEEGLDPRDIELVMSQADCSRKRAVHALLEHDQDIVNAIMGLYN
ncbi:hypothetical protein BJ508DRAFT_376414 [Ascobolus immersus RN42]|uniref:Nascent polypeptide-associated complex subunit alpha-like UBA domain-containing protein n=1 Tax=Ascobolus immersus RN42 TaxID=1160509 RepID=A0A3N4I9Z7_ASCIM|nr:hypothetical protein BJ508DRAFT_376414 [Ascobolus immersus RN42]